MCAYSLVFTPVNALVATGEHHQRKLQRARTSASEWSMQLLAETPALCSCGESELASAHTGEDVQTKCSLCREQPLPISCPCMSWVGLLQLAPLLLPSTLQLLLVVFLVQLHRAMLTQVWKNTIIIALILAGFIYRDFLFSQILIFHLQSLAIAPCVSIDVHFCG